LTHCGCFLPDLTGLAGRPSAADLPSSISVAGLLVARVEEEGQGLCAWTRFYRTDEQAENRVGASARLPGSAPSTPTAASSAVSSPMSSIPRGSSSPWGEGGVAPTPDLVDSTVGSLSTNRRRSIHVGRAGGDAPAFSLAALGMPLAQGTCIPA
jgi:hypothetical protein